MAATNYTPISLYYSATTTNVPLAANLVAGELALNTADGKLFYKDSSNVVQVLGTKGGVGSSTTTQVLYNSSGLVVGSANMTFNGTTLTSTFSGALNGTVGATTPAAGTFTTLTATSTATLGGDATTPSLVAAAVSGGTRYLQVTGSAAGNVQLSVIGTGNPNMQLVTRGTGGFTFSTNATAGTQQFGITHTASAVNYIEVTGNATGTGPNISATGSDASVDFLYSAKGTGGSHVFRTNSTTRQFQVNHTTTAVNYAQVTGNVTGSAPAFSVAGSDTDISLTLTPKGAGSVVVASASVGVGTTTPTSGIQTAGSSSKSAFKTPNIAEVNTISATAATGTIQYDITTQSVLYYTTSASGNFTVNFRGSSGTSLNTVMQTGESISATFLVTNGATAYYNSAVTVDGTSVTPKWQGGTAPTSGNASSVDSYTYVIIKTGSAAFTILASQTKFA